MINQEIAAQLLEKLDKNKKEIEIILERISIFEAVDDIPNTYFEKTIQHLVLLLEVKEAESLIIQDRLALEYERLEIEPILEQLNA